MPDRPHLKTDIARNLIEKTLGPNVLVALDSMGIGVYWRHQIRFRQQLLLALMRNVKTPSVAGCPFAQVAGVTDPQLLVSFPVPGGAHDDIIRRHYRRRVIAKRFVAKTKRPLPREVTLENSD